ncbi:hypothetical protein [Peribacillus butanolivorans]|uniref:hypothetical protein n=1 Tax=Peribacillus butanolivorans TaxID=421767 RepID=UPI0036DD9DF8
MTYKRTPIEVIYSIVSLRYGRQSGRLEDSEAYYTTPIESQRPRSIFFDDNISMKKTFAPSEI